MCHYVIYYHLPNVIVSSLSLGTHSYVCMCVVISGGGGGGGVIVLQT